jgi:hypothetical protein
MRCRWTALRLYISIFSQLRLKGNIDAGTVVVKTFQDSRCSIALLGISFYLNSSLDKVPNQLVCNGLPRDLCREDAPENLLYVGSDEDEIVKISDFGKEKLMTSCGSPSKFSFFLKFLMPFSIL